MGRIFIKGLGAVAASVMVFFMSFHISSCGGGGGGSIDSNGNRPNPKYTIPIQKLVRAGTPIIISCPSCVGGSPRDTSSTDGNGHPVRPKTIVVGKVPFDIPANSELVVTFPSDADSTDPGKK